MMRLAETMFPKPMLINLIAILNVLLRVLQ
jgi:hypothetical protein